VSAVASIRRRGLLQGAGSLTLTFFWGAAARATTPLRRPGNLERHQRLSAWLRIDADNTVTLMVGKVELGQGILTAVAQVCAEELQIDLARLKIIAGDTAVVPNEGVTAGSRSMAECAAAVRGASAEVRELLVRLAAIALQQPAAQLRVQDGVVLAADGRSVTYGQLVAERTLDREATGQIKLKRIGPDRYVGTSVEPLELRAKVLGQAVFVHEMRPTGMLHGHVVRPPSLASTLRSVDLTAAQRVPGVVKVVRNGAFLGVIAQRQEQAAEAARQLSASAQWDTPPVLPGHEGIYDWLLQSKQVRNIEVLNKPAPAIPVARAVEAEYRRPYQMHASIGPSAAIAVFKPDGGVEVMTHSQSVFETADALAKLLGIARNKVRLRHVMGSGCYGHNMADDAAADAALLAREVPGRPVRLIYTREDEHLWEPYGSAMVMRTRAQLDERGDILDWRLEVWSTSHFARPNGNPANFLSARFLSPPLPVPESVNLGPPNYAAERNAIALYEFPGQQVVTHFVTAVPLRASALRGLGAYSNVFAIESFIDELAAIARADPLEYRLRYLKDQRAVAVLQAVAKRFAWSRWSAKPGHGRGIAFARYKNLQGYCAVAMEVSVDRASGRIRVVRVVASADGGHIVHPANSVRQIEGGIVQSLSWSLKEEVRFDRSRVLSRDWESYPILTFSEVPPIEVELMERRGEPFLGLGEVSQGPTGAALANAVADATGVRLRQLPFVPERVLQSLAEQASAPRARPTAT
jgi:nicotinate dehydrogenase subunit B